MAIGNGIRPEVWREFVSRFGNIQIKEFYGATEGNFAMINYIGKVGAVGRDTFVHKVTDPLPPSPEFHIMKWTLLFLHCGFLFL